MKRMVYVAGWDRWVTLGAYVRGIKKAKANPDATFQHGLTSWAMTTGKEIVQEFRRGMHERINGGIPYIKRGVKDEAHK